LLTNFRLRWLVRPSQTHEEEETVRLFQVLTSNFLYHFNSTQTQSNLIASFCKIVCFKLFRPQPFNCGCSRLFSGNSCTVRCRTPFSPGPREAFTLDRHLYRKHFYDLICHLTLKQRFVMHLLNHFRFAAHKLVDLFCIIRILSDHILFINFTFALVNRHYCTNLALYFIVFFSYSGKYESSWPSFRLFLSCLDQFAFKAFNWFANRFALFKSRFDLHFFVCSLSRHQTNRLHFDF
jgi:hypothetical protein